MELVSAVRCGNGEAVEERLRTATSVEIHRALMTSIFLGNDVISELIIRSGYYNQDPHDSKRCQEFNSSNLPLELINSGQLNPSEYATSPLTSAVLRNQVNIVRLLVSKGERIEEPHPLECHCESCKKVSESSYDELEYALTRLNTYRALCNEIYIIITSTDPILRAFELSKKMTDLAGTLWNFAEEYNLFADNLRKFSADLIDCVRNGDELKIILKRGGERGLKKDTLARLKLAIHYKHKQFVTHWTCQEKLAQLYFDQYNYVNNFGTFKKFAFGMLYVFGYPFAVILYMLCPCKSKISQFVETPIIKNASSIASYILFMLLVILLSSNRKASEGYRLSEHQNVGPVYLDYCNRTLFAGQPLIIQDVFVRSYTISLMMIILSFFVVGLTWQSLTNFLNERSMFWTNPYNVIDVVSNALYLSSIGFEAYCLIRVKQSLSYFSEAQSWSALEEKDATALGHLYYLDADRHSWSAYDLFYISDCFFSIASVLTVFRLTFVLAFNRKIGPLVVSLCQMSMEVVWFMSLLLLLIFAFVIGVQNIHWYYSRENRAQAELGYDAELRDYGRFSIIFGHLLFSIFGVVEMENAMIRGYNSEVMNFVYLVLFACFEWVMIIILLNILIARMSQRYENVADQEELEWRFFATMLVMEYMRDDDFLCVPFNLIPSPRKIFKLYQNLIRWCQKDVKKETKYEEQEYFETVIERVKERFMQRHLSSSEDDSKTTTSSVQSLNRNKSISRSKNKSTMETNKSGSYCQSSESENNFIEKLRSSIEDHIDNANKNISGDITINDKVDTLTEQLATLVQTYRQESACLRVQNERLLKALNSLNASQLKPYDRRDVVGYDRPEIFLNNRMLL